MKKIIAIAAFAATMTTASAASLVWGFGSGELFLAEPNGQATIASEYSGKSAKDNAAFVLAYLGSSSTIDYENVNVIDSVVFGVSGDYAATKSKTKVLTAADGYSENDYFAVLWFDGLKYSSAFDIAWPDNDIGPVDLGSPLNATVQVTSLAADKQFSVNFSKVATDGAAAVVVPEPGTAALALLGVGMLLKRRKA